MAGMWCSSCGQEIGHPEDDLHDPDDLSGIPESLGLEGIDNEDAHVKVVKGPGGDGHRFMCRPSGKITKLLEEPPNEQSENTPSGGDQDSEPNGEEQSEPSTRRGQPERKREEVYDLQENKTPEELVAQVVTNEIYGLNDSQIKEMQDWVGIYDGRIPPDRFEEILRDFDGVSKQKARLMRTKYEVMLDREMRRQADDRGPSIGATAAGGGMPPQGGPPSGQPGSAPPRPQPPPGSSSDDDKIDGDLREERRKRRISRRNDALDTAAEQFADAAARQVAEDFGGFFGDAREVLYTAFKKKAEKDPDWFFEKMEQWDIDILDAILEPSETRKRELEETPPDIDSLSEVDSEIDRALEQLEDEEGDQSQVRDVTFMDDSIPEEEDEEKSERIELDDVMEQTQ